MWDNNSEYPDASSARAYKLSEEKEILDQFNSQSFRLRTGFFKVRYYYPPDNFLQHVPIKETVKIPGVSRSYAYKVSRFRNGYAEDWFCSVDIQEIVRTGGRIDRIFEGIIYERNFETSPFRTFVQKLFELRKKYKVEKNKVGDDMVKLLLNALYGKTVQKDIDKEMYVWNEDTLRRNFDDTILSYHQIRKVSMAGKATYIVEKRKEKEHIDVTKKNQREGLIGKTKSMKSREVPIHLGSFILAHSRRTLNNFLLPINAYKDPTVQYYQDTDSTYTSQAHYDILDKLGHVGGNMCQGKNDYENGGIVFGMYLGSKIKYNIVLDDGILSEKKTFKGNNREMLSSTDFFTLESGASVRKEMIKPWTRNFAFGVRKPQDDDKKQKKFLAIR